MMELCTRCSNWHCGETEHVAQVAGETHEDQEQFGITLERSLPLLQQEETVFRVGDGNPCRTMETKNTGQNVENMQ